MSPARDIAPDQDFAGVRCPHCDSETVTLVSLFGSSISEAMFRCDSCRTVFNWVKWRGALPPVPAGVPRD